MENECSAPLAHARVWGEAVDHGGGGSVTEIYHLVLARGVVMVVAAVVAVVVAVVLVVVNPRR